MKLIPKSMLRKLNRTMGKTAIRLRKHLPDILIVIGVTAGTGAVVAASVETTKIDPVLDNAKAQVDAIHTKIEEADNAEDTAIAINNSKKELTHVYMNTAMNLVKLYLPAVALQTLSIVCTISGHKIMRKRNVELAAAYTAIYNAFQAYRGRVINKYGPDVDYDLYNNTTTKSVVDSETGKEEKIHVMEETPEDYLIVFDSKNPNYDINPKYCRATLTNTQQYANDLLFARGYVFLNEVLEDLNMPVTTRGQVVGWCLDDADTTSDKYVDLHIEEVQRTRPDGLVETIFTMDPNVDGTIVYKLGRVAK